MELVVVFLVLALAAALLLPGIGVSREAGRRARCLNNLRQIGLALQGYHGRAGSLPPTSVVDWNTDTGWWSWIVRILPDLDQGLLYERIDLREDVWTNCHQCKPYTSQRLAVLLCPSDPYSQGIYESDELCTGGEAYALTSYLGCRGSTKFTVSMGRGS